jgi:hypothetical protein
MNKQQVKQLDMINIYLANGMIDTVARSLSSMIRCAMTKKSKLELINIAIKHDVHNHKEFII